MLIRKVEDTIRRYDMIHKGDHVLVGVSGGPDSIFLLLTLNHLKEKKGFSLSVANLDHGIRGNASTADSRFVRDFSGRLKLRFVHKKISITKQDLAKKLSTEELLREKRYLFFRQSAASTGANAIATGHTLDDQAETVLMRVIRGTTIKGLVGIYPVRDDGALRVIRPLLEIEKEEITTYLGDNKIEYRVDHTNMEERYFRNAVRNRIVPYLLRYNPNLKQSLCSMAESLREDREFIETQMKKNEYLRHNHKYVSINLKDIVIQPKSLQREILRDAMIESGASVKKLTFRHWRDMDDFLRFKRKGQSLDLPGGVIMQRDDKTISLRLRHL